MSVPDPHAPRSRQTTVVLAVLGLVAVLAVVAGIWFAVRAQDEPPTPTGAGAPTPVAAPTAVDVAGAQVPLSR